MNEYCDRSTAFQLARLKSERLRILILLSVIGLVFVVRSFRTALYHNSENIHLWMITSACLAIVVLYEWLMLRAVDRALQCWPDIAPHRLDCKYYFGDVSACVLHRAFFRQRD